MDKNKTIFYEFPVQMKKIRSTKEQEGIAFLDPKHAKVLRIRPGEIVKILLANGKFALGEVIDEAKAKIIKIETPIEPKINIYLILSMLKRQSNEIAVEFTSQIGVKKIIPVITERVNFDIPEHKRKKIKERFMRISSENARVSGTIIPEINDVIDMKKVPEVLDRDKVDLRIVFWEDSKYTFKPDYIKDREKIAIFVGPEGGFSEREIDFLRKHGFSDFNLGRRIIKAEFFPIYICSVLDFISNIYQTKL